MKIFKTQQEVGFGHPLRKSDPMQYVLGNYFGVVAASEQQSRKSYHQYMADLERMNLINGPRNPTRASILQGEFVKKQQALASNNIQLTNMFKMKQFLAVKPRTDTHNTGKTAKSTIQQKA